MKKIEVKKDKSFKIQLFMVCSIIGVTAFFGVGYFFSGLALASDAVDEVTLTVPNSCSIAAAGDTIHSVTMKAGLVRNAESPEGAISKTTITAFCNSNEGYAVYAIGYSGDDEGVTDMVAASPLTSSYNIATGSAKTGDISNWGMKIIASSGANAPVINTTAAGGSFAGYRAVPETYTKVVSKDSWTSATDAMAGATFDAAYQVYLASNQPAGSYSGKVKYVVVNPSTACPEGYKMKDGVCTPPPPYMQNVSTWGDTLVVGASIQVVDERDKKEYTVAKLADGKIWMLDNLALDLTNSEVLNSLTDANTNASSTSLTSLKSGNRSAGNQYATAGVANWTSSYSYSAPLINMASKDIVPSDALSTAGGWKVGGYYNYCAASAGSYCYGDGTSAGTSENNATEDICPKGWRMPGVGVDMRNEYNVLYGKYNDYTNFRNALHLPLSGKFFNESASNQGSSGGFWSSIRSDDGRMSGFYSDTDRIYPVYISGRYSGYAVRCVAGS